MDQKLALNPSERSGEIFQLQWDTIAKRTSFMFAGLMGTQWLIGIIFSLWVSPLAWAGTISKTHIHVWSAIFVGGMISSVPIYIGLTKPEEKWTRHIIAIGQMLSSALLIHLTGGRIETHFHIFGSLAFIAFYRDWRVLMTATAVIVIDHAFRGVFWPASVYGVPMVQAWRFAEHASWVLFMDFFLLYSIRQGLADMREMANERAHLEITNRNLVERTEQLEKNKNALLQSEKLSAIGQLASGIAHEINNPLGVILGFSQSIKSRLPSDSPLTSPVNFIENEAKRCREIVANLLTFSRTSDSNAREPLSINTVIEETLNLVLAQSRVKNVVIEKDLAAGLPPIPVNKNQIQQVLLNLCNNAMDAMPKGGTLTLRTGTQFINGNNWIRIAIIDTGTGIPEEIRSKIFDPFFTTKEVGKGTGLGLSIIQDILEKHEARMELQSKLGEGTEFQVLLPTTTVPSEKAA